MYRKGVFFIPLTIVVLVGSCQNTMENVKQTTNEEVNAVPTVYEEKDLDTAYFASGCFWCVEAVFQAIPGVISAVSGYSGGNIKNPGYGEVCTGRTGHAEVVQVTFDADIVPLDLVLDVFFATHDPTTLNRQGADVGTQYRSAIYFHEESHKAIAEAALLRTQSYWGNQIYNACRFVVYFRIVQFKAYSFIWIEWCEIIKMNFVLRPFHFIKIYFSNLY